MGRQFIASFATAIVLVLAASAIAALVFDLRIEKDSDSEAAAQSGVSEAEAQELFDGDTAIIYYCVEDRGPKALVDYSSAVDRLIGIARLHPTDNPVVNEFELISERRAPTMVQRLTDTVDLIRRKCTEGLELGDNQYWENDVIHLQEVAEQLALETAGQ